MAEALELLLKIVFDRLFPERAPGTDPGAVASSRLEEICTAVSSLQISTPSITPFYARICFSTRIGALLIWRIFYLPIS